ncbi:hypothetical protein OIV83_003260 [Microbotryomycetes sp. JL201]|nr:hypothetical protein OIV83_003260 [Microbotryomycetes sp. JL201]
MTAMPVPVQPPPLGHMGPTGVNIVEQHRGRPTTSTEPAHDSRLSAHRSLSRDHGSPRRQSQLANGMPDLDAAKASMQKAAKDLSHVPCKFFKANSCTAGASCPFSHDMTQPGTCALAHILPGQPMSYDRKNKRAAQTALREAQAQAVNAVQAATFSDGLGTSPASREAGFGIQAGPPQSGLARSLHNTVDGFSTSRASDWSHAQPVFSGGESLFGSPPGSGQTFDQAQSFNTATHHSKTATFISAPSGLSQTLQHTGATSGANRSSMAAQLMLGEQARRSSNTSETLSPPRLHAQSRHSSYMSTGASSGFDHNASSPRATPASTIFGTSPFQGSRGLFLPSSFDSNEDLFGRSPPARNGAMDMRRSLSNGWPAPLGGGGDSADESALDAQDDDDELDEAFLPSSLNDLLTPEEQRRRASKVGTRPNDLMTLPSPTGPAASRSVPAEISLARTNATVVKDQPQPRPRPPVTVSSSSIEGTNPRAASFTPTSPPVTSASGLSSSVHLQPRLSQRSSGFTANGLANATRSTTSSLDPPLYSSSFDNRSFASLGASPPSAALLTGSLPGGLAAGLSQLHLTTANYTGDTPTSGMSTSNSSPAFGHVQTNSGSGANGRGESVSRLPWSAGWSETNAGSDDMMSSSLARRTGGTGLATCMAKSPLSHVSVFGGAVESKFPPRRDDDDAEDDDDAQDDHHLDSEPIRRIRNRTSTITAKLGLDDKPQQTSANSFTTATATTSVGSGESDVEDIQFTMDA